MLTSGALFAQGRSANAPSALEPIKVSENGRFLVSESDEPFFWFADTAWELFHRLTREETILYLDARQKLGFNVIQAVAVSEFEGNKIPNRYGFLPFVDENVPTPAAKDGPENDYWDHVDFVVDEANKRGMYVGFLPCWGSYWKDGNIFNPENARAYGEWLGKRYKDKGIVWILGGDREVETERERATLNAMAEGLIAGGGKRLTTFHPRGWYSSSKSFHDAPWLDFNMRQSSHNIEYDAYMGTHEDYCLTPVKPVLDCEPIYEDIGIDYNAEACGESLAADCRRAFYWDVFDGACGHTYGHHSVWQFYDPTIEGRQGEALMSWQDALKRPGPEQIRIGKELIESRPFLSRIPDRELIVPDEYDSSVPGRGIRVFTATRDVDGSWAMIYLPVGRDVTIDLTKLSADNIHGYLFDPRTGRAYDLGVFNNSGKQRFAAPLVGEALDWVLVLDDASKNYPAPGKLAPAKLASRDGFLPIILPESFPDELAIGAQVEAVPGVRAPLENLKVSENGRFLVTESGKPFFWLGDTAWDLLHRSSREDVLLYLQTRCRQGYNVVMTTAISEFAGDRSPNRYGFLPFINEKDPVPAVKDGPDNDFWDHVDFVVDEANRLGIYVGLLPSWGWWWKEGLILTPDNAGAYGEFLGKRYKDKKVIWVLGGDNGPGTPKERATVETLAAGIHRGSEGKGLMTFHPGQDSSADPFHNAEWLDFNMRQNGHDPEYGLYSGTAYDYAREPVKPIIDGEPLYEDHPVNANAEKRGHSLAFDIRRAFYWDVFNGAFGHTYGHHSVWQWYDPDVEGVGPTNRPLYSWKEALNRPGAEQMQYGKRLIESRPFLTRVPDWDMIVPEKNRLAVPGAGVRTFVATRDQEGSWAMIYIPVGRAVTIDFTRLNAEKLHMYLFNPRNGKSSDLGVVANKGKMKFTPPCVGELLDWVLVVDDASKNYPKP